jgi:uncharacterized protein
MPSGEKHVVVNQHAATICERCEIADRPLSRMRGLLGRTALADGEGLLVKPAPAIHTWFMRFPIDAVFLDRRMSVIEVAHGLEPWRTAACRGARAVLELAAGESRRRGIRRGDRLTFLNSDDAPVPVVYVRVTASEAS